MIKTSIYNLVIEITRKCNMKCVHCLRGDAQDINIPFFVLDTFFSSLDYISSLTISGGEPSLASGKINEIISLIKKYNIQINHFYIATNGKHITEDFVISVMRLFVLCEEKDLCCVHVSSDKYHEKTDMQSENILDALSFVSRKEPFLYTILDEGNANKNQIGHRPVEPESYEIEDYTVVDGVVYLNALGKVIAGCDFSYDNQEEHVICNYNENLLEQIKIKERIGENNDK